MIDQNLKNANILIVDDQEADVVLLVGLLNQQGYSNIKTVTDSRLAVSIVKSFKPDLIMLDLTMPMLTGMEIIQQLKVLLPEDSFLPIVVFTADNSSDTKTAALKAGAKDFLTKPFDLIELGLRVKNLLETRYLHQKLENWNRILEEKLIALLLNKGKS